MEGYWLLGERILEENENFERVKIYGDRIVQRVAISLNKSSRTIRYAVQFYKKFQDLNLLPEGKNTSWSKICKKYLPIPKVDLKPLPKGKYSIIYADPPWKYEFSETTSREIENQYPTMELQEIKGLKVPSANNAVLFLWTTAPKLKEALEVMEYWGFTYRTNVVWDKEIIGMGYWDRGQHELLLIGVKGVYPAPPESARESSVYREKRGEHSKKPGYYYSLIEKLCPNGKYLELFARNNTGQEKWTFWGNEFDQKESCKQNLNSTVKDPSKIANEDILNIDSGHRG